MADLIDVARYILDSKKTTTGMKLHKILYYCQVWHYIWNNSALMDAEFSLNENGIICNTLYKNITNIVSGNPNRLSIKEIDSIDRVIKRYGDFTIHELISLNKKEIPVESPISFPDILNIYQSP